MDIVQQAVRDEPVIRSRVAQASSELGVEHEGVLKLRNELACILSTQSKFEEAISEFKSVLQLRLQVLHESHRDVLLTRRNLSLTLEKAEQLPEAEEHMKEVYRIQLSILGETNRDTLGSQRLLALQIRKQGRLDEAERQLVNCVDINERNFGMDRTTTQVLNDLAILLKDRGKTDSARQLLEKCIRVKSRSMGRRHPSTRSSILQFAKLLQDLGEHEETVMNCADLAIMVSREIRCRSELIDILRTMRASLKELDTEEARKAMIDCLTQLLAHSRLSQPSPSSATGALVRDLAAALKAASCYDKALPYYRELYTLKKAYKGDRDRGTLTALNNLATCYKSMERPGDAIPLFRAVLEQRVAAFGPADHEVGLSQNNLAMALYKLPATAPPMGSSQSPWEEAFGLLMASRECLGGAVGAEHPDTLNTAGNLAILTGRLAIETLERPKIAGALEQLHAVITPLSARLSASHPWTKKFQGEATYLSEVLDKLRE
jgi:tetratricopeptide (TPR) repeat protein